MGSYVPSTPAQRQEMLEAIGLHDFRQLYRDVPEEMLLRDGLVLNTHLTVALYNEELRGKLTALFAKWPIEALRSALDMLQEARQGVGSFVNRRLVLEALFLQIGKEVAHGHHRGGPV